MALRALITGIGGFVAGHLAHCLLDRGVDVFGTRRPGHRPPTLPAAVVLQAADLQDCASIKRALGEAEPDWVFHLAGVSAEAEARQQPERAFRVNLIGTLHLYEALQALDRRPRVMTAGSSAEYGAVLPEENPLQEGQPLRPVSPYGVSKAAQGLLTLQQYREHGFPAIHVRAFNHTGPGQREEFATASFARQIAEAEAGLGTSDIAVGNTSARRDLSDVRDVCRAYVALMETGRPGEVYNVGAGQPVLMSEVLEQLIALSSTRIRVVPAASRLRPIDVPLLFADTSKLRRDTGWQPQIPLSVTLADLLASWRETVSAR
jgi:GDP-4-dehydro-6-deoxy-D-mannose reductase